jgi:hypothetical protein
VDTVFLTGVGAVVAAVVVFCGGIWMLLTMVLGARLAYFVVASITLAFVLIMSVVWSFTPLGPVGQLPEYDGVDIGAEGNVDFGQAGSYPNEPWQVPNEDDEEQTTKASEAESAATDVLEAAITDGEIDVFESVDAAQVTPDSTRLLEQDGVEYAAVMLEPVPEGGGGGETAQQEEPDPSTEGTALVIMKYDPGNPQGLARLIALGTLVVLAAHIFGLSRAEEKARRLREQTV